MSSSSSSSSEDSEFEDKSSDDEERVLTSSESEDLPSSTKRGKSRRHSPKAKRKTGKKAKTGRGRQSKGKSRREGKDGEPLQRGKWRIPSYKRQCMENRKVLARLKRVLREKLPRRAEKAAEKGERILVMYCRRVRFQSCR